MSIARPRSNNNLGTASLWLYFRHSEPLCGLLSLLQSLLAPVFHHCWAALPVYMFPLVGKSLPGSVNYVHYPTKSNSNSSLQYGGMQRIDPLTLNSYRPIANTSMPITRPKSSNNSWLKYGGMQRSGGGCISFKKSIQPPGFSRKSIQPPGFSIRGRGKNGWLSRLFGQTLWGRAANGGYSPRRRGSARM